MFDCRTCQKSFTNKSSLKRHEHNHEAQGRHKCIVCDADFHRHDLLVRHQSIHGKPATTSTVASTLCRSRLRSRTACEQCRADRAKCSGRNPCTRCVRRNSRCLFSRPTRVDRSAVACVNLQSPEGIASPSAGASPLEDLYSELPPDLTSHLDVLGASAITTSDLVEDSMMPSHSLAWPWIHEDLFLQHAIDLDGYQPPELAIDISVDLENHVEQGPTLIPGLTSADRFSDPGTDDSGVGSREIDAVPGSTRHNGGLLRGSLVAELVSYAVDYSETKSSNAMQALNCETGDLAASFRSFATRLQDAYRISTISLCEGYDFVAPHVLDAFVELYFEHFWILWPLFPKYSCSPDHFEPLLYLTLASIGAMYGGKKASCFGSTLHNKLREVLAKSFLDQEFQESGALALGQARSLTQAAALYFGQRKAFSYAQHIGSVLTAQARKMDLFTSRNTRHSVDEGVSDEHTTDRWIRSECRKRLAFAIMRLEMYTSTLYSTRPLVSAEEMDIPLPCSSFLWHTKFKDSTAFVAAIDQDLANADGAEMWFSDLIRIASDPQENLPRLDFLAQELLMNALQENVWLACNAISGLRRLKRGTSDSSVADLTACLDDGLQRARQDTEASNDPSMSVHLATTQRRTIQPITRPRSLEDYVASHGRSMASLDRRCVEVTQTLRKWQHSCLAAAEMPSSVRARSSLLSCLLLYHLSFMRLHSAMDVIHSTCCMSLASDSGVEGRNDLPKYSFGPSQEENTRTLRQWSRSQDAVIALQHAIAIFELLQHEAQKPATIRARVNFLTLIGLYHSAAVVWTIAGTRDKKQSSRNSPWFRAENHDTSSNNDGDGRCVLHIHPVLFTLSNDDGNHMMNDRCLEVVRENSSKLMEALRNLFERINPAWAHRSSFSAAVKRLAAVIFPSE